MRLIVVAGVLVALAVASLFVAPHLPWVWAVACTWAGHLCALVAAPLAIVGGVREWREEARR